MLLTSLGMCSFRKLTDRERSLENISQQHSPSSDLTSLQLLLRRYLNEETLRG